MKRDADTALRAYYEALNADPIPAIEVRIGRRLSGPILPLAAGVCAAALLPLLAPAQETAPQAVMGMAAAQPDQLDPQTMKEKEEGSWVV